MQNKMGQFSGSQIGEENGGRPTSQQASGWGLGGGGALGWRVASATSDWTRWRRSSRKRRRHRALAVGNIRTTLEDYRDGMGGGRGVRK